MTKYHTIHNVPIPACAASCVKPSEGACAPAGTAACATKDKAQSPRPHPGRPWRLIVGVAMAAMAVAPARSTILFRPVGSPPEVFGYNGIPMSQPVTGTNALNSPKVYLIFVGPNWNKNGEPADTTLSIINNVKAMLNSSYLSGLTQYGSDGKAVYGGYTIDTGKQHEKCAADKK
jgi:hypothetical protein